VLKRELSFFCLSGFLFAQEPAQVSEFTVDVPMTLSGGAMYTQRVQFKDPSATPATAGFQAMLYPTVKLGPHWFGYAAIQVRSNPYLYYDAFSPQHDVETNVLQAYMGYSMNAARTSVIVKAGQLVSAFGGFPLRYDDAQNPLLDQPLSYITTLTLRDDQLPCGTNDLLRQFYGSVSHLCGGAAGRSSGLVPATLYGLPGAELDVSSGRFDGRFQLTSGSPVYGEAIGDPRDYLQWAAGGGYTIRQGFRVGMSAFRGAYLDDELAPLLHPGASVRDFPATAIGLDAKWARGRWSASGELQRFRFDSPNFVVSPALNSGYLEAKTVLTPRLYVAGRAAFLRPGSVLDNTGVSAGHFAARLQSYETAAGFWVRRNTLLKGSYEWLISETSSGTRANVLGLQIVFTVDPLVKVFR
jgi:hypothetical protein